MGLILFYFLALNSALIVCVFFFWLMILSSLAKLPCFVFWISKLLCFVNGEDHYLLLLLLLQYPSTWIHPTLRPVYFFLQLISLIYVKNWQRSAMGFAFLQKKNIKNLFDLVVWLICHASFGVSNCKIIVFFLNNFSNFLLTFINLG